MVRVHEPGTLCDNPVPVEIRVVPKGDVILVLEPDQACHGIWGRAVHPDLAVLVNPHETECGIEYGIDYIDVEPVDIGDYLPEGKARASQRIGGDLDAGRRYGIHVDDIGEVFHVRHDIIMFMRGGCHDRLLIEHPPHIPVS